MAFLQQHKIYLQRVTINKHNIQVKILQLKHLNYLQNKDKKLIGFISKNKVLRKIGYIMIFGYNIVQLTYL